MWFLLLLASTAFLWFVKASGIAPDLSWLVVLAPLWIPWVLNYIWDAVKSGGKRGKSRGRKRGGSKKSSWRSTGNIFK